MSGNGVKTGTNIIAVSYTHLLSRLVGNMVKVDGGRFQMGATSEQGSDANSKEKPVHEVTLSDYYMGKYEVRQSEWEVVMGSNPSRCLLYTSLFVGRRQWEYAEKGGFGSFVRFD